MPLFPPPGPQGDPDPAPPAGKGPASSGPGGPEEALAPLAQRLRPRTLDEYAGQKHLLGEGKLLRLLYESGRVASLILWGPPGTGKTSLARLLVRKASAAYVEFSAVLSGIKDVREVVTAARNSRKLAGRATVLFVDEIHRFNKAQQDAFLPHVESGLVTLIGATTENPSFEIIPALISRARVLVLEPLSREDLDGIVDLALSDRERGLGGLGLSLEPRARDFLIGSSGGDARSLLNALELAATLAAGAAGGAITEGIVAEAVQKKAWRYDKGGEEHYNLISALHKSLRDSDPDGALYWLSRMLEGGEDPVYLLRRMIRFASEDVGEADPESLTLGAAALESYRLLGSPEGDLALAQLAVHLACAPKSNSVYAAFGAARKDARELGHLPVPLHIRNAPTRLMKELGYGKGYLYAHGFASGETDQEHLPEELRGREYYSPTSRGREKGLAARLGEKRRRMAAARAAEAKEKARVTEGGAPAGPKSAPAGQGSKPPGPGGAEDPSAGNGQASAKGPAAAGPEGTGPGDHGAALSRPDGAGGLTDAREDLFPEDPPDDFPFGPEPEGGPEEG